MAGRHPAGFNPNLLTYAIGLALVGFAVAVVVAAEDAFQASLFGLKLWLDAVLPALMPFFALSEILAAFGVIHFLAVLFEPLMRPLFNIPGAGGFALAMGLVSGYPLGALITARLCRQRLINSVEGERLVALANTADPLFMAGVVAAGFFHVPELGATLSAAHYLAALAVGIMGAFHAARAPATPAVAATNRGPTWRRALEAMARARREDGRPFGTVMGDAIRSAMASMLLIGGTIILFSVLLQVLERVGLVRLLAQGAQTVLRATRISPELGSAAVRGLLEITNGTQASAQGDASLVERAALASFIIGWSGLSVHAQVAALIQGTGIRMGPYLRARLLHGLLAAATTVVLIRLGPGPWVQTAAEPPGVVSPSGARALLWHLGWAGRLALLTLAAYATGATLNALARRFSRHNFPRAGGKGV